MRRVPEKPIRTVLRWQAMATVTAVTVAGYLSGPDGALSAALGGSVSFCAGWASAKVAGTGRTDSPGGILVTALKAEGVKLGMIALLLALVMGTYREVVVIAFLGTFVATALIFSMAFFVRDNDQP